MKYTSLIILSILALSCKKEITQNNQTGCIDKSLINPQSACTMDYRPVCGCDGKTYSNSCVARTTAGVTSFKEGACN